MNEHIRNSNLIEGIDSEKADKQSMAAWRWLSKQDWLNHGVVCELQKRITKHQDDLRSEWRGSYRNIGVRVGDHKPPDSWQVGPLMSNWLDAVAKGYYTPKQAHIRFEKIHPFVDGNGRTGRMLMWWHEEKLGRKPTLISVEERQEYYKWFRDTPAGERTEQ